jgi:molybdopterin/thiamine biosynthesis adenylyltransferase
VSSGIEDCALVLDPGDPDDRRVLAELRADPRIEFIDTATEQTACLQRLRPSAAHELVVERTRWAYYPWRRAVVHVLGRRAFRAVRLDRNRNLITADEQARLGELRVGVIGLSVGHAVAYTLAAEGLCGELRLADFDDLELSNLNRVPATVFDLGVNKARVAARRIAELDPYLPVRVLASGITPDTVGEFLDGLDVVVEECDSLDMKVLVRESARFRRIPVLMATSDRGLVDIERYDVEPARPVLHGLLGEMDAARLAGLTNRDKVPHVLRILDGAQLSARTAASLVEVGATLSTWPQLAGEVALGGTIIAEAIRRIGLGEVLPSGRVRIDVADALVHIDDPAAASGESPASHEELDRGEPAEPGEIVAGAAMLAPSGGNAQPWHVEVRPDSVSLWLAPECTSSMDVGYRASAVAVGAAVFNARVAASAHRVLGPVRIGENGTSPLHATVRLDGGDDPDLARLYEPMLSRETNRHHGAPVPIRAGTVESLTSTAHREGGRLQLMRSQDEIDRAARILAATDRIRYLTPRLHAEMFSELRWPGDESTESGIDVRSLELDPGDLVKLDILRRPEVMAHLARWDAGTALGEDTRERVRASAAVGVVSVRGHTLTDYARGGSAVEAVWIIAQQHGLAVQPVSPVFLYAHHDDELRDLSPSFAATLRRLQSDFRKLANTKEDESQVLVLRFSDAPPTSVRSRRRSLRRVGSPMASQ